MDWSLKEIVIAMLVFLAVLAILFLIQKDLLAAFTQQISPLFR